MRTNVISLVRRQTKDPLGMCSAHEAVLDKIQELGRGRASK